MKIRIKNTMLLLALILSMLIVSNCAGKKIEGTKIIDNEETRLIIKTVEIYRKAMESRDANMLIALASKNYFEKNGDSNSENNYDYIGLVNFLRSPEFRKISALKMVITYKSIEFNDSKDVVTVRYYYTTEFKIPPARYITKADNIDDNNVVSDEKTVEDDFDKEVWHSKNDENEMILELNTEDNRWYISKGM